MFASNLELSRERVNPAVCVSVALHACLLAAIVLHRSAPISVMPQSVVYGNGKESYHLVYLARGGNEDSDSSERVPISAGASQLKAQPKHERRRPAPINLNKGTSQDQMARAGTSFGSALTGPTEGREIRPALPVFFPDPPIARSELPGGLQGDVIAEVTIDTNGAVIAVKLLQSLHGEIDGKVLATLQTWRFTPATMDGMPVVSKHDVHFHFPS